MQRFGEIVRAARIKKGLSLHQVASASGTFKGYICGIEHGSNPPPSPKVVAKIAKVLDLDYHELLARSAFEKLPKGLRFVFLQDILAEATVAGRSEAMGRG